MGRITAGLIRLCNLRSAMIIATAWILVNGLTLLRYEPLSDPLNRALLRLALGLSDLPVPKTSITVIHVPDIEYDSWVADFSGATALSRILNAPSSQDESGAQPLFGVILERPFSLIQSEAESLLAELQQERPTNAPLYQELDAVLQQRSALMAELQADNLVLGLQRSVAANQQSLQVDLGVLQNYPDWLVQWLWPKPPSAERSPPSLVLNYFSVAPGASQTQYLVRQKDQSALPTFLSAFWRAANLRAEVKEDGNDPKLVWRKDFGLMFGEAGLPLSGSAAMVPLYGAESGIRASLRQITLGAALTSGVSSEWVLLGRDGSDELDNVAQTLAALGDGAYLFEPMWWSPTQKVLLGAMGIFLCFVLPCAPLRTATAAAAVMLGGLLVIQVYGQGIKGYSLPVAPLVLYLLVAFPVMCVWRWQWLDRRTLTLRADQACLVQANGLIEAGEIRRALTVIKPCRTTDELLQVLYRLYNELDTRRQYVSAVAVLREIKRRKRRYREVNQKLKLLQRQLRKSERAVTGEGAKRAAKGGGQAGKGPPALARTHVLTEVDRPRTTLGRYQIHRELGRGASGTVYLGYDPKIARDVAIKTLNYRQFPTELEEVKARFFREAEAAGRLSHASIVPVFDVGEEKNLAYIAMDYAKGQPLSAFVEKGQLLPSFEVYRIAADIADALAYAHQHHIVHRDIKPGNVMYDAEPFHVRVTDFGIARLVDHAHTRTGEILGSPLYMAPEQLLGERVTHSADIFSLGVMFYQLLSGELPFNGDHLASLSYEIVHTRQKNVRSLGVELPASAHRITSTALRKKPGERYVNAAEMAEALRKALRRDFASEAKERGVAL